MCSGRGGLRSAQFACLAQQALTVPGTAWTEVTALHGKIQPGSTDACPCFCQNVYTNPLILLTVTSFQGKMKQYSSGTIPLASVLT